MPWSTLKSRLAINPTPIPLVLAGPMLREVTPLKATVWFATRAAAKVTVTVFAGNAPILQGARHTTAIGTNLHIVAVTATLLPPMVGLSEGAIYEYDAVFDFDDPANGTGMGMKMAAGNRTLSYLPSDRPSFCLPPADLNKFRLIHGSCRHANGEGTDSLAIVDRLIDQSAANPDLRPHQMLLMGDQIYADDVGGSHLMLLTEAADALLGWQEILPVPGVPGGMRGNQLPPYWRYQVATDAGLTSDAQWNHIFTLGEYICLYLMSWSSALWDMNGQLPDYQDVADAVPAPGASARERVAGTQFLRHAALAANDVIHVNDFTTTLDVIQRALANIPTYTILDDHDVTDDYNMTRDIAVGVYGNPMGRRVVQNALTAYSLCQHWGNVPDQFLESDPTTPGMQLLAQFAGMNETKYDTVSPKLQQLVGVHDDKSILAPPGSNTPAVFHDAGTFTYNYTIEGPGHQIIVTDSRTWRSFPNAGDEAPELLPQAQIDKQIGIKPDTGNRALLVVLSTNMPPVPSIRFVTRHPTISNAKEYYPDLFDSWELPSFPFDRLMKALTDRLPKVNGVATGQVILLSGDVHSSFATRLLFTGTSRLGDPSPGVAVKAVFAQLISSSLRNQTDRTVKQHHKGYDWPQYLIRKKTSPEAYAGWNITAPEHVMDRVEPEGGDENLNVTLHSSRTIQVFLRLTSSVTFKRTPDWGYRLDYLKATAQNPMPVGSATLAPFPRGATPQERQAAAQQFRQISGDYRNFTRRNTKREMIGVTNVSEVTFDWGAGNDKRVLHTVRWTDPDDAKQPLLFTTYVVSLDPDDPNYTYDSLTKVKVGP